MKIVILNKFYKGTYDMPSLFLKSYILYRHIKSHIYVYKAWSKYKAISGIKENYWNMKGEF